MTISLILNRGQKVKDVLFDVISLKGGDNTLVDQIEESLMDQEEEIETERDEPEDEITNK